MKFLTEKEKEKFKDDTTFRKIAINTDHSHVCWQFQYKGNVYMHVISHNIREDISQIMALKDMIKDMELLVNKEDTSCPGR